MNNNPPGILVVDDEKGLRTGVKRLLEAEGFKVDIAENGTSGIKLGTEKEYDVAIIDLKMPDVDGLQVLKEIKRVFSNTICLIATAYSSYENAIDSIKFGAYSYIPKPFTSTELLERVNEAFERRKNILESEKWRREREESLLDIAFEKTRLNTIINSMAEGVLVVNRSGQVVLYNPNALKFLLLDKIKIEEYIVDKLHPDLSELINKILPFQPAGDKPVEQRTFSKEIIVNPEFAMEVSASPVPHPDGSLAGVVVLMKNITEAKKIETLKSQFVSMVSHELKAPIAAVYGYLQLLSDGSVKLADEQRRNFISRSKVRLDGLLKLVNDLLDISKMETKQRELKDYELSQSVKFALDTFQNEIKNKELHINLNIEKDLPLFKCDEDEINRIFTNLISNAIKYNKINGEINISISSDQDYIIIKVKDNGIGMKEKEQEKLFQEFYRAKNEFTKDISGTGLGLSIVKKIADSYSGRIEVESKWGSGTSIKICFPK
jgi:two-component system phosphate regulon sensor histidine kinase PhoR